MIRKLSLSVSIFGSCSFCFDAGAQTNAFHRPSEYKTSWQRLHLRPGASFFTAAQENQVYLDSNLIFCSRSFRLTRLSVGAEGIDTQDLTGQLSWIDRRVPAIGLRQLGQSSEKNILNCWCYLVPIMLSNQIAIVILKTVFYIITRKYLK
ncbi:hypothetical protein HDF24_03015 [Mucilaginibacter sp. X4EP1]|uniref:hypothetical protein n=1 Tax=Mucilaginibacter sp. X4EP1 TaxID=2723092 RepID=UPI002167F826|nr:hypothetical protein [Mucilaginibacter sp. X4EP1]MCS3811995.1 hypothetical protein [Mucilaginibacter sp. X4EP1]